MGIQKKVNFCALVNDGTVKYILCVVAGSIFLEVLARLRPLMMIGMQPICVSNTSQIEVCVFFKRFYVFEGSQRTSHK